MFLYSRCEFPVEGMISELGSQASLHDKVGFCDWQLTRIIPHQEGPVPQIKCCWVNKPNKQKTALLLDKTLQCLASLALIFATNNLNLHSHNAGQWSRRKRRVWPIQSSPSLFLKKSLQEQASLTKGFYYYCSVAKSCLTLLQPHGL